MNSDCNLRCRLLQRMGMSDVEAMLKNLWLSKHLIIHPHAIHTFDVSQVSEPDEGDEPSAIGKGGHESAFCALTKF